MPSSLLYWGNSPCMFLRNCGLTGEINYGLMKWKNTQTIFSWFIFKESVCVQKRVSIFFCLYILQISGRIYRKPRGYVHVWDGTRTRQIGDRGESETFHGLQFYSWFLNYLMYYSEKKCACIHFLWLLQQIITNMVAKNNRNLFSHYSRGQKSETKVSAGPCSTVTGRILFSLLPASRGSCH